VTVQWRPAARADVLRIINRIAEENPVAARGMAQELFVAAASLAVFPRRGRRGLLPGTRELVVARPYVVVYEVDRIRLAT
jgi:toxin ParE1/3/4